MAVLIALGLLLALAVAAVGGLWFMQNRLDNAIERVEDPFAQLTNRPTPSATQDEDVAEADAPMNILVLGSDSRISAGDPDQWSYGAQRTDSIMLVHIPGDRSGAFVMSIPRDSWVDVPGYGMAKINAAFSYGGPSLLIETIENLTGVYIDHFAVADFESFQELTDAVGGVEISVAYDTPNLPAGEYHMDGEQALSYARERYNLPGGDFDRVQRQQNWIRAIARQALTRETLTNPLLLNDFLTTAAGSVAVDEGFTIGEMRSLALSMTGVRDDDLVFLTVPVAGTGWSPDGTQSIVNLAQPAFSEMMAAVAEDDLADYLAQHPDEARMLTETVF
ncbi:LCP family protein [Serinibacter salmoneus]|nr:LCP family protein [Serinibacter salmoneus]